MKRIISVIILAALVAGCSWWDKDEDDGLGPFKSSSAKELYTEANKQVRSEQYASASKRLEALESMYPFSEYAEPGNILLIYAYYRDSQFAAAAAEAEHFTKLYPRSKYVDYAYYMKGLADFQQPRLILAQYLTMDESLRDPGSQSQAYTDFSTFVEKFPHSRYYSDALRRLIYLRNQFALRQLHAARFYFNRKMYVAAAGRASYLVQTYPQAPSVKQALIIMYRSYKILGLTQDALDAATGYEATYHQPMPKK
ncbi:MAG: outer membrane protein assembly factor BamD [Legionellales bacterium RIFCSPHIGHO2_12_FULL_37_14]|nr:MAG: outer membrane protein assembly factor BamD [Legionellales bacterium RIFCSPHIGHO2_12_FULL_37_14]